MKEPTPTTICDMIADWKRTLSPLTSEQEIILVERAFYAASVYIMNLMADLADKPDDEQNKALWHLHNEAKAGLATMFADEIERASQRVQTTTE